MINKISTYESYSEGFDDIVSEIRRAGKLKYSVSFAFTVTFEAKDGEPPPGLGKSGTISLKELRAAEKGTEVQLFRDRGIRLKLLEDKVRELGGLRPTLHYYVERRIGTSIDAPIVRIEAHLFRTP